MSYLQYFLNKNINAFFTESAHWIDLVSKLQGLSVTCPRLETPLPGRLETSGQIVYCYYWHTSRHFNIFTFFLWIFVFEFLFVFANQHTVHTGGVTRGWSVAVAVCVSDRWQVTSDMQHVIRNTWHMTLDMWPMTPDTGHMTFFFF